MLQLWKANIISSAAVLVMSIKLADHSSSHLPSSTASSATIFAAWKLFHREKGALIDHDFRTSPLQVHNKGQSTKGVFHIAWQIHNGLTLSLHPTKYCNIPPLANQAWCLATVGCSLFIESWRNEDVQLSLNSGHPKMQKKKRSLFWKGFRPEVCFMLTSWKCSSY